MQWRPILTGALRDRAMQLVRQIAAAVPPPGGMIRDPSLASGSAGLAVLFAYLDRAGEGRRCGDRALSYLAEALERLKDQVTGPSLFQGAAGVAWAATHLGDRSQAAVAFVERADRALQDKGSCSPWQGAYDLSDGMVGPGVYLLERLPGDAEEKSRSLLEGAVAWLQTQRLGDPGVAAALLAAARATRDTSLERQALAIARHAAMRPPFEYGVTEPGFCHGSAGLAHKFNRMYRVTGDEELRLAARFWMEQTLAMGMPDPHRPGLLRGAAGVALSLLAAATDVEPAWDRLFLLSYRERAKEWSA